MSDGDRGKRPALVAIALGFCVAALIFVSYAWMFYDMGGSRAQYAADSERNAQHNAAYTAQRIENECVGAEGPALRDCIAEAVEAGAEYQQSERDLEAQRGMAKWAFWLLVVASGQLAATVIALIYLKGTLDATWRAVKDTGDATKAMVRQNELTEAAQRPWLRIGCELLDFEKTEGGFEVTYEVTLSNVGGMVAKNVWFKMGCDSIRGHGHFDLTDWFEKAAAEREIRDFSLIPGDETRAPGKKMQRLTHPSWDPPTDRTFRIIINVAAHYRREGAQDWHVTETTFAICRRKGEPFFDPIMSDGMEARHYSADETYVRRYISGRTT